MKKTTEFRNFLNLKEAEEVTINFKGQKFVVTPSIIDENKLELREGNDNDGYDVIAIINSLDEIVDFI